MLCSFADGTFTKPLVIGKAQKPRCFKNIDVEQLPVIWRANKKAWMTGKLMEEWLLNLNAQMVKQNRKILLFMDNASSHPHISLSNIEIVFLPPNCTSVLQPMDQGPIYTAKVHYRKRVLSRLCRLIHTVDNVSQLCKSINVLDAVYWIAQSVGEVSKRCVGRAFEKSGFFPNNTEITEEVIEDDLNLDELGALMARIECTGTVADFISMDSEVYTENDEVGGIDEANEIDETNDTAELDESDDPDTQQLPTLNLKEMLLYAETMKHTALTKGNTVLSNKISECLSIIEGDLSKGESVQKTLDQYFKSKAIHTYKNI